MQHGLIANLRVAVRSSNAMRNAAAMLIAGIFAIAIAAGCSSQVPATAPPPPPPPPAPPGSPHVITDLSQLSSQNADVASLNDAAKVLKANPSKDEDLSKEGYVPGQDLPSTLRRLFLNHPESARYTDTPLPHTQERLLNAKAAQYPGFVDRILTQMLKAMLKLENKEPIVTLQLPEELKPVIVLAILNDKGQLKELIYQQHSGLATVDDLVIEACKHSLWANNLPTGALAKDGHYRLRVEAELSKYSEDREGKQTFITRVGLGIM